MPITYDNLRNIKRDLNDTLHTVQRASPSFISLFVPGDKALAAKHEWNEDAIRPRGIVAKSAASGVLTLNDGETGKIKVGTLLSPKNDVALLRVVSISGDAVTVELVASNGSDITAATLTSGEYEINGKPNKMGSYNEDGEEDLRLNSTNWNATQIFRKNIKIPRTWAQSGMHGNLENNLERQEAFQLMRITEDMNRLAFRGVRVLGNENTPGTFGGIYQFAEGGTVIDGLAKPFSQIIVNDAVAEGRSNGANMTTVICHPNQARVLSQLNESKVTIVRGDEKSGSYVGQIVNDITGTILNVIADYDMIEKHAWVVDPECFATSIMQDFDEVDATPNGYDGQLRRILGELTLEFRNAKDRCVLIKNLKDPAEILASLR